MPNLSEYIRSLKSYNPGISDRAITIYLLKDGWTIDEIEKTFKEINGVTPAPEVSATSPMGGGMPDTVAVLTQAAAAGQSAPLPGPTEPGLNPAISTMQLDVARQTGTAAPNSIPYPTYQDIQDKVNSLVGDGGMKKPSTSKIIDPNQPKVPEGSFGAPVPAFRPNFSYNDVTKEGEFLESKKASLPPLAPVPTISGVPEIKVPPNAPIPPTANREVISREVPATSFMGQMSGGGALNVLAGSSSMVPVPKPPQAQNIPINKQGQSYGYAPGQFPSSAPTMTAAQAEAVAKMQKAKGLDGSQGNPKGFGASTALNPFATDFQPVPKNQVPGGGAIGGPVYQQQVNTLSPQHIRAAHSASHGRTAKILFTLLILLLVLGGGGLAFMKYVYGIYIFVQPPFAKEDFLTGFTKSLANMDTAIYEASISFKTNPKEENIEELNISKYADSSDEIISLIPTDASFSAAITGIYDRTKISQNGKFGFKGMYSGDGVSINVDVESIKVGEIGYVRINTFPSFFIDLAKIKDKWIAITKDDIEGSFGSAASLFGMGTLGDIEGSVLPDAAPDGTDTIATKAEKESMRKQYMKVLEIANEMQVVEVIGDPVKKVQGEHRAVYEYEVKPNLDNLIAFMDQMPIKMEAEFGSASKFKRDPEAIAEMKGVEFAYYFNYVKNNTKMLVGVDSKGLPAYIDLVNKTAPKDKKFQKQLETNIRIAFNNVNGKNTVKAPVEAIPFIDAYSLVTGKSQNDIMFDRVQTTITSIRSAITEYEKFTGTLPLALSDLRQSTAQLALASSTFKNLKMDAYGYARYEFATSTRPLYSGSFRNIFTEKELTYVRVNNIDYQLIYDIRLPSLPKQSYDLLYGIGQYDNSDFGESQYPMIYLSFIEGLNTATKKSLSKEADSKKGIDTDKDRVSDAFELYIGTDTNKKDTDGDGVSDYDEIRNGTNPKGNGAWKGAGN